MGARAIDLHLSCVGTEGLSATAEYLRIGFLCTARLDSNVFDLCSENVNHEDGPKKRALGRPRYQGSLYTEIHLPTIWGDLWVGIHHLRKVLSPSRLGD